MIETKEIKVSLGDHEVKIKVVKNSEEILTEAINDAETPVWVELWPSSLALARWLWNNKSLKGQTVLELGAGLGLPGVAAGMRGAEVLQTDYMPEALEIAGENARLNKVNNLRTAVADWRNFNITERFDFIIGSDILYHPDLNPFLKRIFQDNLKPGGKIVMADAGRKDSLSFVDELRLEGWPVIEEYMPVQQGRFDYRISIFSIQQQKQLTVNS
jgi:predicted nicotinamide N-methyase